MQRYVLVICENSRVIDVAQMEIQQVIYSQGANLTKYPVLSTIMLQNGVILMTSKYVYTVQQVAEILQISTKTMYAIVKNKDIDSVTVRGQIRITDTALQAYLQGETKNER